MVSPRPLIRARNVLADGFADDARSLAGDLVSGTGEFVVRLATWLGRFLSLIRHGVTGSYLLGRGTSAFDARGFATVSDLIAAQHGYARDFAAAIRDAAAAGAPLGLDAVANRAGLYAGGSVILPFETGNADKYELTLPAMPADGSTPCLMSCRCTWQFDDSGDVPLATWIAIDDAKTCDVCAQRGEEWVDLDLRDNVAGTDLATGLAA